MVTTDAFHDWNLPDRIARLKDLAYNLWWSWHPEARALFKEMDRTLWAETHHNPVRLLRAVPKARLDVLLADAGFLSRYDAVIATFDKYMTSADTWFGQSHPEMKGKSVGYFSAEFGVHNSLRIYSGGLGVLAGDHCKAASDLGVPLGGVGFMFPQGYGQQKISSDGWQQNVYESVDWDASPIRPVVGPSGGRMILDVPLGRGTIKIAIWRVQVGRVPLYLMDANVEGNSPGDRESTGRLYGGDRTTRLRQEILLGIGGVRVLRALGIHPSTFHATEGHSSFLFLELVREKVSEGKSVEQAQREVAEMSEFTTHTPVEAGHDVIAEEMICEYFSDYWHQLKVEREQFLNYARVPGHTGWIMTALALTLAGRRNAVSRRHGQVSREMWKSLRPSLPVDDEPNSLVANGVHLSTWIRQDLGSIYDLFLVGVLLEKQDDAAMLSGAAAGPGGGRGRRHDRDEGARGQMM